jgi:hypothetical protein
MFLPWPLALVQRRTKATAWDANALPARVGVVA